MSFTIRLESAWSLFSGMMWIGIQGFFPHIDSKLFQYHLLFFPLHWWALLLLSCTSFHIFSSSWALCSVLMRLILDSVPTSHWLSYTAFVIHLIIWKGKLSVSATLVLLGMMLATFGPLLSVCIHNRIS